MDKNIIITPKTKIGEMLNAYPQLENVLIELAPAFKKLKNPVLRKTVAKVANLQQAASIGNINVSELVNRLREAIGQKIFSDNSQDTDYGKEAPAWFDEKKIINKLDARPIINSGGHPMKDVFDEAEKIKTGEIFLFITPFIPAPLIDKLKERGFLTYSRESDKETFNNYVTRQ
jgi:hypothetical protein